MLKKRPSGASVDGRSKAPLGGETNTRAASLVVIPSPDGVSITPCRGRNVERFRLPIVPALRLRLGVIAIRSGDGETTIGSHAAR
jgi:hypothetical protein